MHATKHLTMFKIYLLMRKEIKYMGKYLVVHIFINENQIEKGENLNITC